MNMVVRPLPSLPVDECRDVVKIGPVIEVLSHGREIEDLATLKPQRHHQLHQDRPSERLVVMKPFITIHYRP